MFWQPACGSGRISSRRAHAIAVDNSGNVYVTGVSWGSGGNEEDYATLKYDTTGNLLWTARYNGPISSWDEAFDLVVDDFGNVYVTGRSNHSGIWFDFDYATIKYNSAGVQQWAIRFNGQGNDWDEARSIALDHLGNVYVTGTAAFDVGTAYHDYATIKYSSEGILDWVAFFDGAGENWDEAVSIAVDDDGNAYITGYSSGNGTVYDYVTIKYTTTGVEEWARTWSRSGAIADVANALAIDEAGNVFVTGSSGLNYATVKYDNAGNEQWVKLYGASGDDIPYAVVADGLGGAYVTGGSANAFATIRYDPVGTQDWVALYNGPGSGIEEAMGLAVDPVGNVYVAGYSRGSGTAEDITTIKYSQPTSGVDLVSRGNPAAFRLGQNQPNPFRGVTTVEFDLRGMAEEKVELRIYDLLGQEVATLVDGRMGPGTYRVDWDAAGHADGTYFYKLSAEGSARTGKMVLMR